jgi:hypothetical protein
MKKTNYKKRPYKKRSSRTGYRKPSFAIQRFQAPKKFGQTIKTCDTQFVGVWANPFIYDQLQPPQINIDTTGVIQCINLIQQGASVSQRIANKIGLKSLRLRFDLAPTGHSVPINSSARFMVVYDRNPNAGYPAINTMIQATRQDGTFSGGTMWDSINPNLIDRFVVLMDEFKVVPAIDNGINGTQLIGPTSLECFKIDKYIKLKGLETVFQANSNPAVIGNVQIGALYLVSWGNTAGAAAPYSWVGGTRLRFHDN